MPRPPDVPPEPAWLDGDAAARLLAEERAEVDDEVAERVRAEWATARLADRWRASVGRPVSASLLGDHRVDGCVADAGEGWVVVDASSRPRVLNTGAVVWVEGLADAVAGPGGEVTGRLGPGHALRALAATRRTVRVLVVDGTAVEGTLVRVLNDAVDVIRHPVDRAPQPVDRGVTLPWTAVAAVVCW